MLYIILLLVVVLIIAVVVLKKRGEAQAEAKPTFKGTAKKGLGAKTATKTKLVEEPIVKKQATTPLDDALRSKIENLIKEKNFSAAEAQINQALNRDNSQHDLYLLLLDIHVLQKDEFAVGQLLNHLRSLELEDVVAQAEIREAEFKSSLHEVKDTIDFPIEETTPVESTKSDFSKKVDTQAFDQLQGNVVKTPDPIVEIETLDFNFQPTTKFEEKPVEHVEEKIEIAAERTLEFGRVEIETTSPEPTPVATEDFSQFELKSETAPVEEKNTPVELDFSSFNLDAEKVEDKAPTVAPEIKAIELDFTGLTETTPESAVETVEPVTEQPKESLDFSFSQADVNLAPTEPEAVIETTTTNSLDFNFSTTDTPIVEEKPVVEPSFNTEPNLDFNLLGESTTAPIAAAAPAPVVESIDENDPLVQAFPELAEQSEAELNLVLASQYIQLGAFEAARELLDETQDQFNSSQQQRAEELRNQLA
jgi:FimV-like protein